MQRPRRAQGAKRQASINRIICFISYLALNLGTTYGSAVGFLFLLPVFLIGRPKILQFGAKNTIICFAAPIFYTMSFLWSNYPDISLKLGIEAILTTICGVVIVTRVPPTQYISALFYAQLISVLISLGSGNRAIVWETKEYALIGLFGSKNNFALAALILLVCSAALLIESRARTSFAIYCAGIAVALVTVFVTISAGALITASLITSCLVALYVLRGADAKRFKLISLSATILILIGAIVMWIADPWAAILAALGKEPTLTGRTDLWEAARGYISLRPLLGLGYQSFWVQGSSEAEYLWEFSNIPSRTGFHFHNLFYATAVEVGYIGVFFLFFSIGYAFVKSVRALLSYRDVGNIFAFTIILMFISRIYSELDFLSPFGQGTILLPIILGYASRGLRNYSSRRPQRGGRVLLTPRPQPS